MNDRDTLDQEIRARLKRDYNFRDAGKWLRRGKCPGCGRHELFAAGEHPRVVQCGRKDNCGFEANVKDLYDDLFNDWSSRFPPTPESPTAAADAYLLHGRKFDLLGLRDSYTQEYYHDRARDIGSATIRFDLPGGGWWERIIDQPNRFERKANFAPRKEYGGEAWLYPGQTIERLAIADEIWFDEGIFDTIALEQGAFRAGRGEAGGRFAVSLMSCYNWPEKFLQALRETIIAGPTPGHWPELVFALDLGAAGAKATRDFVEQARAEGWPKVGAAQVRLDDDPGAKLDWSDLHLRGDRFKPEHIADYRWAGEVLIAASAEDKAFLLWKRRNLQSFSFVFRNRTWWATFSETKIDERIAEGFKDEPELSAATIEVKRDIVARRICVIEEIANCAFRVLYKQRDETTDATDYFLRVDFPTDRKSAKGPFTANACSSGQEFAKRLLAIGTGAYWTGETRQLIRILQRQMARIKDVEPLLFTGYSRQHQAYVLGDLAVQGGRIIRPNSEGFFDLKDSAVKLKTEERILDHIDYDPEKLDTAWLEDFWTAYRAKGLVVLAFWFSALFAEQIRKSQSSLGFLEMIGPPGTGKTSIIEFLWKMLGRADYEGIDPAKATAAALARTLGKVSNIPVVFMEGHRRDDTPHSRKFEWDELLTAYNGRAVRSRGVANGGMETFDPLFRGAILIEQNFDVDASPALLERIMHLDFDKSGWTDETKLAAQRIDQTPIEKVSGFIIHALRAEAQILDAYHQAYARHETALRNLRSEDRRPLVHNQRLAKNHAQLLAMLDALRLILPIPRDQHAEAAELIQRMAIERHRAVDTEHPTVIEFWERIDMMMAEETSNHVNPINHSRDPNLIAIRLVEYEQRASGRWQKNPTGQDLRRLLKGSKHRRFLKADTVNSITGRTVHCWIFQRAAGETPTR